MLKNCITIFFKIRN